MKVSKIYNKYRKYFVIAFLIIVLVSLLGGTHAMFQRIDEAEFANNYQTGNLQIEYTGLTQNLNLVSQAPISDSEGMASTPYEFMVKNVGNLKYKFSLKVVVDSEYVEEHGCAQNLIPANYLKISFNGGTPILLSDLTDNVLLSDLTFEPQGYAKYNIRIWIAEGAPNEIMGKHFHGKIVSEGSAVYTHEVVQNEPNAPVLADGMIPIKYDGTNWVKADTTNQNNTWYNYGNKMWANAVMVSSATRDTYMTADVGTPVQEADILAYYVWIPRYKYQLFNVYFESVSTQLINVVFEKGTASTGNVTCSVSEIGVETCTNKANGNWYTHPAFTFGNEELQGIWVGKFETTYGTNTTNVYPDNTVYATPTIKPNVTSLRNQQVSKQFQTAQYFGTSAYLTSTGVNEVDAHMMKNIEWGAVAYLKQSAYGLGTTDIAINNSSNYLTGKSSGDPAVTDSSATGSYSYNENRFERSIVEGSGTNVSYNITNDTTYPWIQLSDGTYKSQTQGVNSSTTNLTVTFTLTDSGVISFDYSVSSESATYDYLYYTITNSSGTVIDSTGTSNKIGGTSYGTTDDAMTYITKTHTLEAGSYTVVFTYKKDSSVNNGTDAGYVKNIKVVESLEFIIEDLGPAGQLASTTGNITGVYDMSGGAYEYVMGVIQDNTTTGKSPMSGSSTLKNSGYVGKVGDDYVNSGNTLAFPAAKYYDLYANGTTSHDQTAYNRSHLGDATGETAYWYFEDECYPDANYPWFDRGGYCGGGFVTGVFNFCSYWGGAYARHGFRVVLSTTGA